MNEKHYKEKLSGFVNHELQGDERQAVAEHLLLCANCRTEHDQIKLGAVLAGSLTRADAPVGVWNKIENALDKKEESRGSSIPNFVFFGSRAFVAAAGSLIICGLLAAIYFGVLRSDSQETVKNETPSESANVEMPQVVLIPGETLANQNSNTTHLANSNPSVQIAPQNANSNVQTSPKTNPVQAKNNPKETIIARNDLPSWNVETLAGTPKIGNSFEKSSKLAVGEFLETDANSRAKIQVANIGNVEIAPNSRVQLVKTNSNEHRLSLKRGVLQAKINAPPRLFIVDTPSAVAVDLGCEYTLEVDKDGNSRLHVTSGYVALERGGRESIVPAGAMCLTKKGKGLGTPFSDESSAQFQSALFNFDFANGGSESLQTVIKESNLYDSLTLWHLLSRVPKTEREKVFEALAVHVEPPANVTRKGILRLDKKMLEAWWTEIENVWFE
ncbi:MAG: FecR domain-containing protein [Pyrinomonadaceae bacterium]